MQNTFESYGCICNKYDYNEILLQEEDLILGWNFSPQGKCNVSSFT